MKQRLQDLLIPKIAPGDIRRDLTTNAARASSANEGPAAYALAIAQVIHIDYEDLKVTLRTQTGESFQRIPVPLTFPGAGARHFVGALPMPGDVCVVGWAAQESGGTRIPYILTWIVPGTTAGYDWLTTQPFTPEDFDFDHKSRVRFKGAFDRVRHKLRHMEPGNFLASSAQGADLVLNESATLTNRRGNEFILRDADQSAILRSLQYHQALAGVRVYSGMVQRTATFLPTQMFSDGKDWSGAQQVDAEGNPLVEGSLPEGRSPLALTPSGVFQRDAFGDPEATAPSTGEVLKFSSNVDPYEFLQRGLYIDTHGDALGVPGSDAVYGGMPLYRVSAGNPRENAVLYPNAPSLTEHRIEISHTSNGRLPVTDETDGFDADRLPDAVPRSLSPLAGSDNAAYIELVYGSVVGKDPFTVDGRRLYGIPLRPVIFDGNLRNPALVTGLNEPMESHAAMLFRLTPPIAPGGDPTFWSVTKDGRVLGSIAGPATTYSTEWSLGAGARIGSGRTKEGRSLVYEADGSITFRSNAGDNAAKYGVVLEARKGAVRIFGETSRSVGVVSAQSSTATGGESDLPAVEIESATSMWIKAARTLHISANTIRWADSAQMDIKAGQNVNIESGEKISISTKAVDKLVAGQEINVYSGPKDANPANLPLRLTSFTGTPATGLVGGTVDQYEVQFGDRRETLNVGNHSTLVKVGNQTYACTLGTWSAIAGTNSVVVDSATGITASAAVGNVTIAAVAGATTIIGVASVLMKSAGPTAIAGSVITLHAPGKVGGIVSMSDLDPVSGLPLGSLGMGSPGHLLAPPL